MPGVVIVAHAPLASALLASVAHVFGAMSDVLAYDVGAHDDPAVTLDKVRGCIETVDRGTGVLVITDMVGATPANLAGKAAGTAHGAGTPTAVIAGANIPMLLRALTYRHLSLDDTAQRALAGGTQGILRTDGGPEEP